MWMYNVFNTRDFCLDMCLEFTFAGDPNSGPPPACQIAPCLLCDEENSGPIFKRYAARTRRRSGLLSKIPRPCEAILIVNHPDPCPALSGNTLLDNLSTEPTCIDITNDVGPFTYEDIESNTFFEDFLLTSDEKATKTFYSTCNRFNVRNSRSGFWDAVADKLGPAWKASSAFSFISIILGGIAVILTWSTTCAAFKQNFWTAMTWSYAICGVFNFLTLVLFASDICPDGGCKLLQGAIATIVAGCCWFIAAGLACYTRSPPKPGRTIGCCCCPHWDADYVNMRKEMAPLMRHEPSTGAGIDAAVTQPDASMLAGEVSVAPDGSNVVETSGSAILGPQTNAEVDEQEVAA